MGEKGGEIGIGREVFMAGVFRESVAWRKGKGKKENLFLAKNFHTPASWQKYRKLDLLDRTCLIFLKNIYKWVPSREKASNNKDTSHKVFTCLRFAHHGNGASSRTTFSPGKLFSRLTAFASASAGHQGNENAALFSTHLRRRCVCVSITPHQVYTTTDQKRERGEQQWEACRRGGAGRGKNHCRQSEKQKSNGSLGKRYTFLLWKERAESEKG